MTLQELLRRQQAPIHDALVGLGLRLEQILRDRAAAEGRKSQAVSETAQLRAEIEAREKVVAAAAREREDLLAQLRQIERQLREKDRALETLRLQQEQAKEVTREGKRLAQAEDQRTVTLSGEIDDAENQKARLERKLREARVEALREYSRHLEQRLEDLDQRGETRVAARLAAEALRTARHSDPQVAALCEDRESWHVFLAGSPPPGARATAAAELQRIEGELEARFPGALNAPRSEGSEPELEELFFYEDGSGEAFLVLPITEGTWTAIEAGSNTPVVRRALQLLWDLRLTLPSGGGEPAIEMASALVRMRPRLPEAELARLGTHSVALGSGATITFLLSQLPSDIAEALD